MTDTVNKAMAMSFDQARMHVVRDLFRDYDVYVESLYLMAPGQYMYRARFKNGVTFESDTPHELAEQVRTYAEATKNLTGEYP